MGSEMEAGREECNFLSGKQTWSREVKFSNSGGRMGWLYVFLFLKNENNKISNYHYKLTAENLEKKQKRTTKKILIMRLPTPMFLPGEFHGQRSLAVYSPWGCEESDMTEPLSPVTFIRKMGLPRWCEWLRTCLPMQET